MDGQLNHKKGWTLKNWCFWPVVLERTLKSPLDRKQIKPMIPKGNQPQRKSIIRKDWCWSWNSNNLATWCKEVTHWKRPWCWERLKARGEGDDRGWDGWISSLTQWTWVWTTPGEGEGQGSLVSCSPWCCKESGMTEQLNKLNKMVLLKYFWNFFSLNWDSTSVIMGI